MVTFLRVKRIINKCSLLQSFYDRSKSLIHVVPFYLMVEELGSVAESSIALQMNIDDFGVAILGPSDMKQVAETPGVKETEYVLLERLHSGWICFGIKYENVVIAHMWCNLLACDSKLYYFRLNDDEAYLTDARTVETYRGKGLAPYLRLQFYKHLHNMGRHKFYSITEYFNEPAMSFKKKLGARPAALYIHVYLLKKCSFRIMLKRYNK